MFQTYQTKLCNIQLNRGSTSDQYLIEYGKFFGKLERKLFVQSHIKGIPPSNLKKTFLKQYGITSRQFNSIRMQLDGKVSSFLEKRDLDLQDLEAKTVHLQKIIHQKTNQTAKLHQKKRRLRNLQQKLEKLKVDRDTKRIRICFGSKKLFHKQFHLIENEYKDHQQWKNDWVEARSSQFLVIGSKDETFGNQSATYNVENTLRLRVADCFIGKYGKYIEFPSVMFPYGQEWLDKAKIPYMGFTRNGKPQKYFTSITYRFIKKEKGWYVYATVERETSPIGTSNRNGLIGMDLNAGFLAVCEVDRYGNPIHRYTIKVPMYGRRKEQVKASLSDAIKEVLNDAVLVQKDIVIEKLNFTRKKTQLKEMGASYARMLSGFAYSSFQALIEAKAKKAGVKIRRINPAYTSQIGHMKFMARYGLSSHEAAACVIARRGYFFKPEKIKYDTVLTFPKGLDRKQSNFSKWRTLTNYYKKEYAFQDKIELLKADR
ncbi:IS200/IS605 family accessory protein TnpB-related protein [Neobacillus sp. PS3-12]|uniref:IS200/IS605 family accessory protein TnpB-related protein n=1 Tax=Neobacillus sp. PS3-12 TaxID=3070677 RepID=UPI0027E013FF|nr:IS200/IS605 family accessory protein TnpB-related protein [Neobacillus sp. PS3-12]WML52106.1 IS200/IS605 family accessory protein TnpB-related protein [Neobacillus sp. PS3-12]